MLHWLIFVMLTESKAQNVWNLAFENEKIEGKIKCVHIIFRNGHNEPWHRFPEDRLVYQDIWTIGPGQLTILGKRQAYSFGLNLQERYGMLIPETQAWKDVTAWSSPTSRCLMTSSVVLAGFIPPSEEDKWSAIHWQPVAVRSNDILAPNPNCPRYEELVKGSDKEQVIDDKLYDYVTEHSGVKVKVPRDMMNIYNNLQISSQFGLASPYWSHNIMKDIKRDAAKAFKEISIEATRLRIGNLLKMLIDEKAKPINVYCTHKEVIGNILSAMKFNITEPPNFMSAVIVEFREIKKVIHVQLWYRIGPNDGLVRLPWPGCGIRCPVSRFFEIILPFIPEDLSKACSISNVVEMSVSLVVAISVLLMLAVFFGYVCGSVRYRMIQKKVLQPSVNYVMRTVFEK